VILRSSASPPALLDEIQLSEAHNDEIVTNIAAILMRSILSFFALIIPHQKSES